MAKAKGTAVVKGANALVAITCAKAGPCRGTIKLSKGAVTVGSKGFRLGAGKGRTINIPLSRKGKELLEEAGGKLRVRLTGSGIMPRQLLLTEA